MDILFYERMSGDMGKLVCIDNEDVENFLTVGKTYECENNDEQFVDAREKSPVGQLFQRGLTERQAKGASYGGWESH